MFLDATNRSIGICVVLVGLHVSVGCYVQAFSSGWALKQHLWMCLQSAVHGRCEGHKGEDKPEGGRRGRHSCRHDLLLLTWHGRSFAVYAQLVLHLVSDHLSAPHATKFQFAEKFVVICR